MNSTDNAIQSDEIVAISNNVAATGSVILSSNPSNSDANNILLENYSMKADYSSNHTS